MKKSRWDLINNTVALQQQSTMKSTKSQSKNTQIITITFNKTIIQKYKNNQKPLGSQKQQHLHLFILLPPLMGLGTKSRLLVVVMVVEKEEKEKRHGKER